MLAKTLPFFVALGLSAQTLTSNPAQIQFGAGAGLSSPAAINVKLTNSTGPSATVSVTTDQPWLSASPSSLATGSTSKIAISVNIAGLAAKTYTGNVIFTAPGYTSATTAVTLIVANPSNTLLPVAGTAGPSQANDFGVVVADLNNDGKLDVATLNGDTG